MEIKEKLEAIIFLGGDSVKVREIGKSFSLSVMETIEILNELKESRKNTGINLVIEDDIVHFVTNPACGEAVNNFFQQESKPKKLSEAALETISIIAYKQPVTKSEIEAIRGVAADRLIINLEEKKFIKVCGKRETPGRPNLYQVTGNFLAYLGINSVEELPNYKEMRGERDGENEN